MSRTTSSLDDARREVKASDAIVVLGAGASFHAGMPLAGQLAPLVWLTLDEFPEVKRATCYALGTKYGDAKEIVGYQDRQRIGVAFAAIASNSAAREHFQHCFARLDRERAGSPSPVHYCISQLVHAGRFSRVISLNWDTLLEVAFQNLFGVHINAQGIR